MAVASSTRASGTRGTSSFWGRSGPCWCRAPSPPRNDLYASEKVQLAYEPVRLPGALAAIRVLRRNVACDLPDADGRYVAGHRRVLSLHVPADGPVILREVVL